MVSDAERHARLKEIFRTARVLQGPARDAFLADECGDDGDLRRDVEELLASLEEGAETDALPGLLSGLVLAGANKPPEDADRDDGFLLAEEISFLDLSRADLVVLSACESGVGRPQSGEGLLRQNRRDYDGDGLPSTWGAFVLDGAWE